jgi:hypothetical protein
MGGLLPPRDRTERNHASLDLFTLPPDEQQKWDMIEQNQRFDMAGFTNWELADSGCLIEEDSEDLVELDGLADIKIHLLFR